MKSRLVLSLSKSPTLERIVVGSALGTNTYLAIQSLASLGWVWGLIGIVGGVVVADGVSCGAHFIIDANNDLYAGGNTKGGVGWIYAVGETFNNVHRTHPVPEKPYGGVFVVAMGASLPLAACSALVLLLFERSLFPSLILSLLGLLINLLFDVHQAAHARIRSQPVPRVVMLLQDAGLLLSPKSHQKHHKGRHVPTVTAPTPVGNYALLTGWTNVLGNLLLGSIRHPRTLADEVADILAAHNHVGWVCPSCTLWQPTPPPSSNGPPVCPVCGS